MNAFRPRFPRVLGAAFAKAPAFRSRSPPGTWADGASSGDGPIKLARLLRICPSPSIALDVPSTEYGNPERKAARPETIQSRSRKAAFVFGSAAGTFQ